MSASDADRMSEPFSKSHLRVPAKTQPHLHIEIKMSGKSSSTYHGTTSSGNHQYTNSQGNVRGQDIVVSWGRPKVRLRAHDLRFTCIPVFNRFVRSIRRTATVATATRTWTDLPTIVRRQVQAFTTLVARVQVRATISLPVGDLGNTSKFFLSLGCVYMCVECNFTGWAHTCSFVMIFWLE